MPNHFHFLLQIKQMEEMQEFFKTQKGSGVNTKAKNLQDGAVKNLQGLQDLEGLKGDRIILRQVFK